MRIFKTRVFDKWAKNIDLSDNHLICVALEIKHGLVTARLGSGIIKQRIGLHGRGKSSSVRVIVAYIPEILTVFIMGFSKSEKSNISLQELTAFKKYAKTLLNQNEDYLNNMISSSKLIEVRNAI